MVEYRIETLNDLEKIWNMNIAVNLNDRRILKFYKK